MERANIQFMALISWMIGGLPSYSPVILQIYIDNSKQGTLVGYSAAERFQKITPQGANLFLETAHHRGHEASWVEISSNPFWFSIRSPRFIFYMTTEKYYRTPLSLVPTMDPFARRPGCCRQERSSLKGLPSPTCLQGVNDTAQNRPDRRFKLRMTWNVTWCDIPQSVPGRR